jgi:hypothetical protein
MDHGRACFLLLKHEAAVWTTHDGDGQLRRARGFERGRACLLLRKLLLSFFLGHAASDKTWHLGQ